MGLSGQQYHSERPISQTALSLPIPPVPSSCFSPETEPNYYLSPPTSVPNKKPVQQVQGRPPKAQKQQNQIPDSGNWERTVTNDALLNARREDQKREQDKVQLPAAKPGSLYPRPSRIPGPLCIVSEDGKERNVFSDLRLSMHRHPNMAYREVYRRYTEEKERKKEEEQRKAALSVSAPEATRTESVKQLLTSVNKSLEHKVEAAELKAAGTESEASRSQSPQQQYQGPEQASQAARSSVESFWHEYTASYPMARQSNSTHSTQIFDSTSPPPPATSPDPSKDADASTRRVGFSPRRKSVDSSLEKDYCAATEAIDKVPGDLLESPTTVSAQDESSSSSSVGPSVVSTTLRNEENRCTAKGSTTVPLVNVNHNAPSSISVSEKRGASPPPIPQPGQTTGLSTAELRRHDDRNVENPLGAEPLGGDVDIQLEWEEVVGDDDSLDGDESWSVVGREVGGYNDARRGSLSSEDVDGEWDL